MSEIEKLVDFLDSKIDVLREDLKGDIKALSAHLERAEEKFATKTSLRHLMLIGGAGFMFLLVLLSALHSREEVAEATPKALLGTLK